MSCTRRCVKTEHLTGRTTCKHYTQTTHTLQPAHVIFSRVAQDLSHRVRTDSVPHKTVILTSSTSHAPSQLYPSHLSTSLSTCTPVRLSSCPSTGPLLMPSSHGDSPCADPPKVCTSPMAETTPPTGYEPEDLTEESNSKLVKLMFFHRPSMTSTYDSAESIATLPPESDLDDEQKRNMLVSPLYLQEREASADRSRVYHSFLLQEPATLSWWRALVPVRIRT